MTLDEVMEGWRAQDASTFFGVDKTVLHQVLRQEQATIEKQWRGERWVMAAAIALFLFVAVLILGMVYSDLGKSLTGWDYVVGVVGMVTAIILAGALFALIRSRRALEQGFGDSLRDHLRRRIALLEDEATSASRLAFITLVAGVIFMWAYPFVSNRINEAPGSEPDWPSPVVIVLILGFFCWVWFRSMPRDRQRKLSRKRQLEALLRELDGL